MFCRHCGAKLKPDAKFCVACGQPTFAKHDTSKSTTEGPTPEASPAAEYIQKNTGEAPKQERKKLWVIVLVIGSVVVIPTILVPLLKNRGNITITQHVTTPTSSAPSASNVQSAVVGIYCDNNEGGSGTMLTTDGTILTNNHVITGATACKVTIPNPTTGAIAEIYEAIPVITPKLSKEYDVATVKINGSYTDASGTTWGIYPTTFTTFTLPSTCNTSTPSQLNDSVKIYGYPVTSGELNLTVTDGNISSFADNGDILTSAKVDSGNSGGLAIDQNGCWLGVPSAVVSGKYQNLGVIIPGSVVENIMSGVPAKYEPVIASSGASALVASIVASSPQETNGQICQDNYGVNSVYAGHSANDGTPYCSCQSGYSWNGTGDACATQLSLQQWCQSAYGQGSYSYPQKGKAVCGCSTGYQWNSDQSACVVVVETPDQICKNTYGANSVYSGQTNNQGGPLCQCESGYEWGPTGDSCVSQEALNLACQIKFGTGSYSVQQGAKAACDCSAGYEWNTEDTACVVAENGYQVCSAAFPNETWDGTYGSNGKYNCVCDAGYSMYDGACVSGYTYCTDTEGYGASYDSVTNQCSCSSGYVYSGGHCVSGYTYCTNLGGYADTYNSLTGQCECESGYSWNGSSCVYNPNY